MSVIKLTVLFFIYITDYLIKLRFLISCFKTNNKEKYPTLFFCGNLVDLNEAHLHEDFHYKENDGMTGATHLIQSFLAISSDIRRVRSLANYRSLVFTKKV